MRCLTSELCHFLHLTAGPSAGLWEADGWAHGPRWAHRYTDPSLRIPRAWIARALTNPTWNSLFRDEDLPPGMWVEWKGTPEAEARMGWKESQGLESCCLQEGLWTPVTVGISATPSEGWASLKGASTWGWTVPGRWRSGRGADGKGNPPPSQRVVSPSVSHECAALGAFAPSGANGSEVLEIVHERVVMGWTYGEWVSIFNNHSHNICVHTC